MRRIAVGILFSLCGIFLQSLTEWVFRHSPIYYTANILLGALAALCYARRLEKKAAGAGASSGSDAEEIRQRPVYAEAALR